MRKRRRSLINYLRGLKNQVGDFNDFISFMFTFLKVFISVGFQVGFTSVLFSIYYLHVIH